jgi:hypothetical protein
MFSSLLESATVRLFQTTYVYSSFERIKAIYFQTIKRRKIIYDETN